MGQLARGRTQAQLGLSPRLDVARRGVPAIPLGRVVGARPERGGEIRGGAGHAVVDVGCDCPFDAGQALLER
ncbi:MAG: hypothetical protein LC799_26675, partial [Actinobacteria bacterium]|nr:hypothetical protein [Actinomycetota bacterium]